MVAYSEYVVITWFSFGWSSPVSVPGSSMGWHDSSGWLLYQFPRLTKYVISQFQLLPLSPGWLLLYNIGYAAPCGCIQVSRTQGTGSHALLFVGQFLDVKYPMSFLRATSALQPLPIREPNAFFFSLVEQKKQCTKEVFDTLIKYHLTKTQINPLKVTWMLEGR